MFVAIFFRREVLLAAKTLQDVWTPSFASSVLKAAVSITINLWFYSTTINLWFYMTYLLPFHEVTISGARQQCSVWVS